MTFVLRITEAGPHVTGVVERVRTGEKHRFVGIDAVGPLIARLMAQEFAAAAGQPRQPGAPPADIER